MALKKIVLKNRTGVSLNERFTYLRQQSERIPEMMAAPVGPSVSRVDLLRQERANMQRASAKNRRLALQMENRPAVAAALRIKKRNMRQRVGLPNLMQVGSALSVKDRLTLSPRARLGWRGTGIRGGRGLRNNNGTAIMRGARGQTGFRRQGQAARGLRANIGGSFRARGVPQMRARGTLRSAAAGYFVPRTQRGIARNFNAGAVGYNNNFTRRGRGNFSPRMRGGNNAIQQQQQRGGGGMSQRRGQRGQLRGRGRGQTRGQQRGRGRNARQNVVAPTRVELDNQLDEYMAHAPN